MSDDEQEGKKPRSKSVKISAASIAMAAFAAITAVGEGVRSCNEREQDQVKAALAEAKGANVDIKIQENIKASLEQVNARFSGLENRIIENDRKIFEIMREERINPDGDHWESASQFFNGEIEETEELVETAEPEFKFVIPDPQYTQQRQVRIKDGFKETVIGNTVISKEPIKN
jgi:hypothetical protein